MALLEELHLKEKLSKKRCLYLYRALLRNCGISDMKDQNAIDFYGSLVEPILKEQDSEMLLNCIECIGLICLISKEMWQSNYVIFKGILVEKEGADCFQAKDKAVALKACYDAFMMHG